MTRPALTPSQITRRTFSGATLSRRLVTVLSLEARPATILLIGGSTAVLHQVEDAFPDAAVCQTSLPLLAGAPMADAVISVFALSDSPCSDAVSLDRLLGHVKPGGHLAFLEPSLTTHSPLIRISAWLGTSIRPALRRLASQRLIERASLEIPTWSGLWRHAIFVGRMAT